MTIQNLYPKTRPGLIYNVINGRNELPVNSSFSRPSAATYVDNNSMIRTVGNNVPRFDHDPSDGSYLGVLLEPSAVNCLPYSGEVGDHFGDWDDVSDQYGYTWNGSDRAMTGSAVPEAQTPGLGTGMRGIWTGETTGDGAIGSKGPLPTPDSDLITLSVYMRIGPNNSYINGILLRHYNTDLTDKFVRVTFNDDGTLTFTSQSENTHASWEKSSNGWFRVWITYYKANNNNCGLQLYLLHDGSTFLNEIAGPGDYIEAWGPQLEAASTPKSKPTSLISTSNVLDSGVFGRRAKDEFSLFAINDFDFGFSLLLDSETSTKDDIYKIKADGAEIASLRNNDGTLTWTINGTSSINSDPPLYPQVGFLPGRVRTISSFGPAEQGDVENYLYTTGLSFPTIAEPAPGADEVEFGVPQTLKALYAWPGQLDQTNAVSLIKGKYNVVKNKEIDADAFAFVWNTDPSNEGRKEAILDGVVPVDSMTVDWGDGNTNTYTKGVTPSHTYPYPGQYRIQILADDGFDQVTLDGSDLPGTLMRVDQWAPQYREDATGPGFTGNDMVNLFKSQVRVNYIPKFKYTNLIDAGSAFDSTQYLPTANADWIPTDLSQATNVGFMFYGSSFLVGEAKDVVQQLKTSPNLVSVRFCHSNRSVTGFVDEDGNSTGLPWTDTSNVTNWYQALGYNSFTSIGDLDTSSATDFTNIFRGCLNLEQMPFVNTDNVITMDSGWKDCRSLEFFPSINTQNCTGFQFAWDGCASLKVMPALNFEKTTSVRAAWRGCSSLERFPTINLSACTDINAAWSGLALIEEFPELDLANVAYAGAAWDGCSSLKYFPLLDFGSCVDMGVTWRNNTALDNKANLGQTYSFPEINTSNVTGCYLTWSGCSALTNFPPLDFSSCNYFNAAWSACTNLADFPPNMFDSIPSLNVGGMKGTFEACSLTAQSIENILVSLDTTGIADRELTINGHMNAGKSTWTEAADAAFDNLIAKGWTIIYNE